MSVKNLFKRKNTVIKLLVTFLFFIGILFAIYKKDLRVDVRMLMDLKVQNREIFELKLDDSVIKARVSPGENFKSVFFKIPKRDIKKVRFFLGKNPGLVVINRIKLKTILNEYVWKGRQLEKLFYVSRNIAKTQVIGDKFSIKPGQNTPSFRMAPIFPEIINKISKRKTIYYLLAVVLTLVFYYIIHYLHVAGLKIFFNRKVLGNMVLIFFVVIFSILINDIFKLVKPFPLTEKRKLTRYSEFRFDSFFDYLYQYNFYFKDHFSLRSHLIYLNNLFRYKLFKNSTVPNVIIGKNGWLFLGNETESRDERVYFRRLLPFAENELKHWTRCLKQRQEWLAKRGIQYLLIIVPNKSTIYPEYMPDHLRPLPRPSRLDQLLQYVGKNSDIKIMDLRVPLLAAKKYQLVYSRTESHWNHFGAYAAYIYIMDYLMSIFPGEKSHPLSRFDIVKRNWVGGDLAAILSLQKSVLREDRIRLKPKHPPVILKTQLENIAPYVRQSFFRCPSAKFPPAICVHDSFIIELRPFISLHFSKIRYIWDWEMNIYPDLIKKDRVKIVIEEMAERYLLDRVLANPEEMGDEN